MTIAENLNVHNKNEFFAALHHVPDNGRKNLINCYLIENMLIIGTPKRLFTFHFENIPKDIYRPWLAECKAYLEEITTNKVLWKID
jgi:hypothetical protein